MHSSIDTSIYAGIAWQLTPTVRSGTRRSMSGNRRDVNVKLPWRAVAVVDVEIYAFGTFQLIPGQCLLLGDGGPLRLGSRALDILTVLIESAGETISNSQIISRVWQTTSVEEAVHQAAQLAHSASGREGRCPQADIADVCLHAGTGDAFPRPAARECPRRARRLDPRCHGLSIHATQCAMRLASHGATDKRKARSTG